ncbi:restriction endonuclease subunit S [Lentibacter sp. XHP0401]|uniref:restriction endonuclease subunit S n=1 Tax=Lentibacter sp. XHP0401 TaxID=2984334 RepID=UPI0021E9987B|nr:restriction endonuclease subunit S [Lentibacter sp. XHP0401]MCV2893341.1 restriction endonuclease subunit S [Lentibacter sp. XHP0401]
MVPEGWSKASLGDVVNYKKGFAFDSSDYSENGVRVIRISDTTRDGLHSNNPKYVAEDRADGFSDWQLFGGDIIVSTVGSRPHLLDSMVGKAVRIPANFKGSLLNQNLVKLAPKKDRVISEILYPHLKDNRFITFISGLVRGNANQVSITLKELFTFPILLPPLPEQQKIADILSTWDQAIEKTEALLSNARTQKRALMQQLLTGKRRFPVFEGQPWNSGKLVDHFDFINGRAFKPDDWGDVGFPIIRIQNLTGSTDAINYYDGVVDEKHTIRSGDFLLSWSATLDTFIWTGPVAVLNQHIFKVVPKSDTLKMFGFHLITHEIGKLVSKVHGTSMKHITKKDLAKIESFFPSLAEQEKITETLDDADRFVNDVQADLTKLRTEKKALMQQLLTGKRRVVV